jgi:cytidine deaminase
MHKQSIQFEFEVFDSIDELNSEDKKLMEEARIATALAYAPYSKFKVGAVAILNNGEIVKGSNQENASYPVGVCAERTLLGNAATLFPEVPIKSLYISYHNTTGESDEPVSPCGMCRQAISEYEHRTHQKIRLIISGMEGKVFIFEHASLLLPLSFSSVNLLGDK